MQVLYKSTRGKGETVTASMAILKGLSEDGGLFVPTEIPKLDVPVEKLAQMTYQETAYEVMSRFLTDFTEDELKNCIANAYDAKFDTVITLEAKDIAPQVTWGTNPGQVIGIDQPVPNPAEMTEPVTRASAEKALNYIGLEPNTDLKDIPVDQVFIGSCTNARIEDLRAAAAVMKGRKKADNVKRILVVPGSGLVKEQAEKEGLDKIFIEAGAEWRNPGCSMCLGMNDDRLGEWERCASTSNRNFEGRQGRNGRTHLVSPAMAAAAGMFGKFVDIRDVTLN